MAAALDDHRCLHRDADHPHRPQDLAMPDANATQSYVLAQLQNRPITAASLSSALLAMIGLVGGYAGSALTGGATPVVLPSGSNSTICLAPGQSVTLPSGAKQNDVILVMDCSQIAGGAIVPLSSPETEDASSDATIAGAASYSLTLTSQGVEFRKTLAGPWQPF